MVRRVDNKSMLIWAAALALAAAGEPCIEASARCTERVPVNDAGGFVTVYRNYPLKVENTRVRRAVIMVHGTGRNADGYFRTVLAAAAAAGRLFDAVVVAPQFKGNDGKECHDGLEAGEVAWPCQEWKDGWESVNTAGVYSYDVADRLVEMLGNRAVFPNLTEIAVAGHSAGGQYLHRYAAAGKAPVAAGVAVRYVVANPSSYLYLNNLRLPPRATCDVGGKCTAKFVPYTDAANCTTYNRYKYGLEGRRGYTAALSEETLRKQLVSRRVIYLAGDQDVLEDGGLDLTCPARAQGANRKERALAYASYIRGEFGAAHELYVIRGCGHSATCMYASETGAKVLFGE